MDGMKHKNLVILLTVLLAVSSFISFPIIENCSADDPGLPKFYVDDDYDSSTPGWHDDHFDKIQDAIDNAAEGDRIIVYAGTYSEHLIINKTSLNVFGEDRDTTIVSGGGSGNVVTISSPSVDFSTFTIKSSGGGADNAVLKINSGSAIITDNLIYNGQHGISISNCDNNKIYYNTIRNNNGDGIRLNHSDSNEISLNTVTDNSNGIFLYDSSNNIIENYAVQDNSENGIFLNETSNDNTISNTDISDNTKNGIYLNDHCDDNIISENQIFGNSYIGIRIENSSTNYIDDNTVNSNSIYGIMVVGSGNEVQENAICYNNQHGIFLFADDNSNVTDNTIQNNTYEGIRLQNSTGDLICGNEISGNSRYGIYLNFYTLDNAIYDNYFHDNSQNALDISEDHNTWNIAKTSGTNVVGGPYKSGNYWDDFDETSEGAVDGDDDGISNNSYSIDVSSTDNGPLLDVINPSIGTPQASPSSQTLGDYTNISATVTDNTEIRGVYLNVQYPNDQSINISITQNKTGNKYFCYKQFPLVGNYSYYIDVEDPRNWAKSSARTFYIEPATDTQPPTITVEKHGPSFDYNPNSYTYEAKVVDDTEVSAVTIEYWYAGISKTTVDMENIGNNYYKKVIYPQGSPNRIYCVIYANDTSGNQADTKNPFANASGPYSGYVTKEITFNGNNSYDLDGNISAYSWNFGDGTAGAGESTTHVYTTNGTYSITLTVTDDDGKTDAGNTYVVVSDLLKITTSNVTMENVSQNYNLTLTEEFYSFDSDGDGIVDVFFDPNGVLTAVHTGYVNLSGNITFLISVDGDEIPEFFWNTNTDEIVPISYKVGTVDDIIIDEEDEKATMYVTVNKANWIYIEVDDEYPIATLTVKTGGRTISSSLIWRKNDKIYVFDDPGTQYQFIFEGIYPALEPPTFSPVDGGIIDEYSPTITVTYNVPVIITNATFGSLQAGFQLITTDNETFSYTPPGYLENGTYTFEIEAYAMQGSDYDLSTVEYIYFAYVELPQQSFIEKNWIWIAFGGAIGGLAAILILFRYKQVTIDGFVYIKNRKIVPFFRTIILGPMSVNIDNKDISKAEFYVDGMLKDTVTTTPYLWRWNERAFLKHTLETKVYDHYGNSISSGEMEFYIFNPTKLK